MCGLSSVMIVLFFKQKTSYEMRISDWSSDLCSSVLVVIEEFLTGEEASFFALTDGTAVLPLGSAQDHKRVGDGDTGPNTGGMGAYSPAPVLTAALEERVMDEIIRPTVRAMADADMPYSGVLYAGLMLTAQGPNLNENI